MAKNFFDRVKKFLPIIGIITFIYLLYSLDIGKVIKVVLSIPVLYILLSVIFTVPRILIRNYAWMMIHREQKIRIGFLRSLKIFLIGYFYGSITPGYIGQLMRVPYMKEETGEPYGKLFVNSFIETTVHTLSLYGMMLIGALLIIGVYPELFTIVCIWIFILVIILAYFVKKERGEKVFYFLVRRLIPKQLRNNASRFIDTFYNDFPKIRSLLSPLLLGSLTWVIISSQEYIIVLSIGANIPYLYFLLLFPVANTVGLIPITFAGLGTRELTAIFLFSSLFAVTKEEVFVFTLTGFIITDLLTGFVGFLLSLTETRKKDIYHTLKK